jgi:outer membrane protein assembly factor BamB
MDINGKTTGTDLQKSLRLRPGIVLAILLCIVRFIIPALFPAAIAFALFGGVLIGLAIVIWWAFFSRAPISDRWISVVLMIVSFFATAQFLDKSISTSMMGMMYGMYAIPVLSLAFVIWAVASRKLTGLLRRVSMVVTILLASGFWVLLRSNGMNGETGHYFAWRWSKTSEERLMATTGDKLASLPADSAAMRTEAEWPGFRGRNRDGIVHNLLIKTDWSKTPPVEIWRRPVGPGCSSFAVHGPLLFTQEQRGECELVTCYNLNTGEPIWRHSDTARFWDSHAGAGPRSTPTLSNGRVYTLGATGILNVLDERDGTILWSHNAAKDTEVKIPGWGYSSSPLVVDSTVLVGIAGEIVAYDISTGNKRWSGHDGGESYSSPHLLTSDGVKQVLFLNKEGATSFSPENGKEIWKFLIPGGGQIVQPALINDKNILINAGDQKGLKCIAIKNGSGGWTTEEKWSTDKIKPYFNDFVVHKGHAYGFDGPGLACVDIENGNRTWRGGRYAGEILLLADQDMMLVLSEKGELALVKATPEQFKEIARFPAIKGKTWNHPVLAGDILVVRNSDEMAAFRLGRQE